MTSIYQLKDEQAKVLEELEWVSDDDAEAIHAILDRIQGDVKRKLDFWITPLKQAEGELEIAKQKKKIAIEAHDKNIRRKESRAAWIRQHVLNLMIDFDIKEFHDDLFNVSHRLTPGALVFSENFNPDDLPEGYVETKEVKEIDKKALTDKLRLSIYDADAKKLDPDVALVSLDEFPGVLLERKESLRIL
ncbi:MAG: siphovirus Gp157 family protein [Taibaiella sp.]|jgi:hypothetical protein